jgi:hypothetical protein
VVVRRYIHILDLLNLYNESLVLKKAHCKRRKLTPKNPAPLDYNQGSKRKHYLIYISFIPPVFLSP